MADVVTVCNMALMRIGHSDTISDITEASNEARICNVFYEFTRDQVLRDFSWPFATKRSTLALLAEDAPTSWAYAYTVPSDCIFVRGIVMEGQRTQRPDDVTPFEVNGRKLYTDQELAELIYTYRVEDLSLWDSQAISALAWLLASELATALKVKPDLAAYARQMYQKAQGEAVASALSEGSDRLPNSEFMDARN